MKAVNAEQTQETKTLSIPQQYENPTPKEERYCFRPYVVQNGVKTRIELFLDIPKSEKEWKERYGIGHQDVYQRALASMATDVDSPALNTAFGGMKTSEYEYSEQAHMDAQTYIDSWKPGQKREGKAAIQKKAVNAAAKGLADGELTPAEFQAAIDSIYS